MVRWAALWILLIGLVLVPFLLFEEQFNALVTDIVRDGTSRWVAAAGVMALLTLDVFLPVPSSVVATAAGVMLGFWQGTAIVWVALMAGCLLGYGVGARGSGLARRMVGQEGLARAAGLAERYGDWALVLCRPVPVLAEASVVFAGLIRAPLGRFVPLTASSNLGIAAGYAAFGAFSMRLDSFLVAFAGALLVPALGMALSRILFAPRAELPADRR